jgi:hypothetical protein
MQTYEERSGYEGGWLQMDRHIHGGYSRCEIILPNRK